MSTAPTPLPKQPLTFAASHLVWIAALAALCALGVYEWIQEHDARVKAEAATAAQQKTIDQAQKDAGDAQQALMVKMAAIDAEKLEPATPRQIVIDTSKLIPNLPQPITIRTAPQQVGGSAGQRTSDGLPDAPAAQSLIVPAADLKAIQAAEIACQEDQAKRHDPRPKHVSAEARRAPGRGHALVSSRGDPDAIGRRALAGVKPAPRAWTNVTIPFGLARR